MTHISELIPYIDDYLDDHISQYEFINCLKSLYPNIPINDILLDYFYYTIKNRDNKQLENAMLLTHLFDKKVYLPLYETLFLENWHTWHEDMIIEFERYGNMSNTDILIRGFNLRLDYMNYNDSYSFHYKLMWAIYKLNPHHAYELLSGVKSKITPELCPTFQQFLGDIRQRRK